MRKIIVGCGLVALAGGAIAQTLPLSQSATFKTKADAANPVFTGTVNVSGPMARAWGSSTNEGAAAIESSHDTSNTGYVSFFKPNQGSRVGYVGYGNSNGLNITTDVGSIYLNAAGTPNPMVVGKDANGKLQIVINNLPTSCSGEPNGTLYASGHTVSVCF